jgi:hypothetical protein
VPEVVEVRVQCRVQQPEIVVGELDRVSHGRNLTPAAISSVAFDAVRGEDEGVPAAAMLDAEARAAERGIALAELAARCRVYGAGSAPRSSSADSRPRTVRRSSTGGSSRPRSSARSSGHGRSSRSSTPKLGPVLSGQPFRGC